MSRRYDLAVVGGGTAGLVAAIGAAGLGARVCVIERDRTGGDCLWTGCVPSKALLAAAAVAHTMRTADAVGVTPAEPQIDFARVLGRVHAVRERIAPHDSPERLRGEGVEVIPGEARFSGPGRVDVAGREVAYRAALIATGSRPVMPPVPGLESAHPLTTDTVWDLAELPRRLVILGGGPTGCEVAQAFGRLGSAVTLVEMLPALLARDEPESAALVARRLAAEGVDVRVGTRAVRVERHGSGLGLEVASNGAQETVAFDRILVAIGRRPNTETLGLERVGVETHDDGTVRIDAALRTSARGVFAAGDVTGALPFTHVAAYHGAVVVVNALFGLRRKVSYAAVPWVTFTDPEVARVGLTEEAARERWGEAAVVANFDYGGLDRALCAGREDGFAKLVADPRGRLVGATVAGPAAGESIAWLAASVRRGGRLRDLTQTVQAYPTYTLGPKQAADAHLRAQWLGERTRRVTRPLLAVLRYAPPWP